MKIAYKIMFSKYWSVMDKPFEHSRIVPCEYALVIDGQRTFISKDIEDVKRVRRRMSHYQGDIA